MTGQQVLVDDGRSDAELREAEYGGTPLPLISQAFVELRLLHPELDVLQFVEPGSGPAPFCRVVRSIFPLSIRFACDVRESEREPALRNASYFSAADFRDYGPRLGRLDLLATNPPFTLAFEWAEIGLEIADLVLLLLPDDWHKRTKDRYERFVVALAPYVLAQMQIPGRIAFYGGSRTDRVSYSWWLLSCSPRFCGGVTRSGREAWPTWMLPMLPAACRRWQGCRPGEED